MRAFTHGPKTTVQSSVKPAALAHPQLGPSRPVTSILRWQRMIGNQALQRVVQTDADGLHARLTATVTRRDVGGTPVIGGAAKGVQRTLAINAPGDGYEQEADRVAEQIVGMPEPPVQRKCACGGAPGAAAECECATKHPSLQRMSVDAAGPGGFAPPIVHDVLRSPAGSLDRHTRAAMGARFGRDFSRVRIHADADAGHAADAVQAHAFTVGRDIVFGSGKFAPSTPPGRGLLAHELTHVVQQGAAPPAATRSAAAAAGEGAREAADLPTSPVTEPARLQRKPQGGKDTPNTQACPPVTLQAGGSTPTLQRQPADKGVAELELELNAKLEERAMLARMLQEASDKIAADVSRRRIQTGSKTEEARLKAGAQGDLQKLVPVDVLKNKIDIVRTKDGFTVNVRIELSYPGNTYSEGWVMSANHIPGIKQALLAAWSVDISEGAYAGKNFRLEPRIEFRPNTRTADTKALQFIVRKDAAGGTVAQWQLGEISFNPEHLKGDRVVIAAHELYHLFGWIVDAYYEPTPKATSGPGARYSVGRGDPKGRADLLGMVDPKKLREWRDHGHITQAEFERQSRGPVKVWQEDAARILHALGAPPNPAQTAPTVYDPSSPSHHPQAAARRAQGAKQEQAAAEKGESADTIWKMERAMQLDKEIPELQKRIADLKARGTQKPAKP